MKKESTMTFVGEPDMHRLFQAMATLIGKDAGVELTVTNVRKKTPEELEQDRETGHARMFNLIN